MIPPLKELLVVAALIWVGVFLCMIPQMLQESESARLSAEYAEKHAMLRR